MIQLDDPGVLVVDIADQLYQIAVSQAGNASNAVIAHVQLLQQRLPPVRRVAAEAQDLVIAPADHGIPAVVLLQHGVNILIIEPVFQIPGPHHVAVLIQLRYPGVLGLPAAGEFGMSPYHDAARRNRAVSVDEIVTDIGLPQQRLAVVFGDAALLQADIGAVLRSLLHVVNGVMDVRSVQPLVVNPPHLHHLFARGGVSGLLLRDGVTIHMGGGQAVADDLRRLAIGEGLRGDVPVHRFDLPPRQSLGAEAVLTEEPHRLVVRFVLRRVGVGAQPQDQGKAGGHGHQPPQAPGPFRLSRRNSRAIQRRAADATGSHLIQPVILHALQHAVQLARLHMVKQF